MPVRCIQGKFMERISLEKVVQEIIWICWWPFCRGCSFVLDESERKVVVYLRFRSGVNYLEWFQFLELFCTHLLLDLFIVSKHYIYTSLLRKSNSDRCHFLKIFGNNIWAWSFAQAWPTSGKFEWKGLQWEGDKYWIF